MILEKTSEECSAFLTKEQLEESYMHAVTEPHHASVIDTHKQQQMKIKLK
jgi:hypothetical protein